MRHSAARAEFKHLEAYYFHNCLYEGVWRDNARRWTEQTPTWDVLRTYGADYKCIFVGDAAMSPYELLHPGGANEHEQQRSHLGAEMDFLKASQREKSQDLMSRWSRLGSRT